MIEFLNQASNVGLLLSAIFGGSVIGGIMKYLTWRDNSKTEFRDELRNEIKELNRRVEKYRDENIRLNDRILSLEEDLYQSKATNQRLIYQMQTLIGYLNRERVENGKDKLTYEEIFHVSFEEAIHSYEKPKSDSSS